MNKLLAYILILILALPLFFRGLVLIDFGFRLNYYATVLCVNKEKPALNCNGTCQLSKVNLIEQGAEKQELPEVFKLEISPFSIAFEGFLLKNSTLLNLSKVATPFKNLYQFLLVLNWDEPPIK